MPQNLYIKWNMMHETGVAIIDEQHRGVVTIINSLYYFISRNKGLTALRPTIKMLEEYTHIHFLTEEALLEQSGWEGLEKHTLLHRKLAETMGRVSLKSQKEKDPMEMMAFLKDWWVNHINTIDAQYVAFLKDFVAKMEA